MAFDYGFMIDFLLLSKHLFNFPKIDHDHGHDSKTSYGSIPFLARIEDRIIRALRCPQRYLPIYSNSLNAIINRTRKINQ